MSGLGQKGQNKLRNPVDELFKSDASSIESLNEKGSSTSDDKKTIRKGFVFPMDLHMQLRACSYESNVTETSIVIAALKEYFANHPVKKV